MSVREGARVAVLLAPAALLLGVLFAGGLGLAALGSRGGWGPMLADPRLLPSLGFTLWIAVASTLLAAALGLAGAVLLRATASRAARLAVQLPLTLPHLIGALGLAYVIGQSGLLARAAFAVGLIDGPAGMPVLVHDRAGAGIILAYVWKEAPFVGLVLLAAMQALGRDHEAVARGLGATRVQAFRLVLWPQLRGPLLAAASLSFAYAMAAFEVPLLLGASEPPAAGVLAWQWFTSPDLATRAPAMALALLTAAIAGTMIGAVALVARRR